MMHRTRPSLPALPLVATAALALAAACGDGDPLAYENRRPLAPPVEIYVPWWDELEACAGRGGDFDGIRWFLADWIGGGANVKGQWLSSREITIRVGYVVDERVVKHEMLHDLLRGDPTHEHEAWEACIPAS